MAKRKRDRKNKSDNLSHEEIWDDSALVRSWDDAVEEYNLYHSIHARGENVEEVLNRVERDGIDAVAAIEKDRESMDIEDEADQAVGNQDTAEITGIIQDEHVPSNTANAAPPPTVGAPSVPDALLGQAQDPALKNLMMAWYYAGYYTGLYEGQRQAAPNNNSANQQ